MPERTAAGRTEVYDGEAFSMMQMAGDCKAALVSIICRETRQEQEMSKLHARARVAALEICFEERLNANGIPTNTSDTAGFGRRRCQQKSISESKAIQALKAFPGNRAKFGERGETMSARRFGTI